jgi:6,7-dimethyl-8-ribityllumazine synthase
MAGKVKLEKMSGKGLRIGIVRALWHEEMTRALMEQAIDALHDCGVVDKNIVVAEVPGSYEVVYGAKTLVEKEKCDAVIALSVLIKGETMHFEYIADAVSHGLMGLNVESGVPVIFGVLTCLNEKQARERSVGKKSHGYDWGLSAVHMASLKKMKKSPA